MIPALPGSSGRPGWARSSAWICDFLVERKHGGMLGRVHVGADDVLEFGGERRVDRVTIRAASPARFMILGGESMDGPRYIWWNFVASSQSRIEQAKSDWKAGRFEPVPGDSEFIPLPER
jgi:hypothetical protein